MEVLKDIVIIYHAHCYDGFGAAWSAWKKFGDSASYVAQKHGDVEILDRLNGKEIYIVDFAFSKNEMLDIEKKAKKLVVIDHHISAEDAVKSLKEFSFALDKSGSYLAWEYFHKEEVPLLIKYISDHDIWTHTMPNYEEVGSYIYASESDEENFEAFNKLSEELETKEGFEKALEMGGLLRRIHLQKVKEYSEKASLISFEGYEIYAVNAPHEVCSELGHLLSEKTNSFSLSFYFEKDKWKCSLRSVKDFDVSEVAKKYGGGGHKNAAGFAVPAEFPLPFAKLVEKKEG